MFNFVSCDYYICIQSSFPQRFGNKYKLYVATYIQNFHVFKYFK